MGKLKNFSVGLYSTFSNSSPLNSLYFFSQGLLRKQKLARIVPRITQCARCLCIYVKFMCVPAMGLSLVAHGCFVNVYVYFIKYCTNARTLANIHAYKHACTHTCTYTYTCHSKTHSHINIYKYTHIPYVYACAWNLFNRRHGGHLTYGRLWARLS